MVTRCRLLHTHSQALYMIKSQVTECGIRGTRPSLPLFTPTIYPQTRYNDIKSILSDCGAVKLSGPGLTIGDDSLASSSSVPRRSGSPVTMILGLLSTKRRSRCGITAVHVHEQQNKSVRTPEHVIVRTAKSAEILTTLAT